MNEVVKRMHKYVLEAELYRLVEDGTELDRESCP